MHKWIAIVIGLLLLASLSGCTSTLEPIRRRIEAGNRMMEWGLVYFRSWLREKDGKYLNLARHQTAGAVGRFFDLQFELGHSYPAFYIIDRRRREGCRFLREIDIAAARNGVELDDTDREGCLK